jgi:hypothetical protein
LASPGGVIVAGADCSPSKIINRTRKGPTKIATLTATEARVDHGRIVKTDTANSPHRIECEDGYHYAVKPTGTDRQFVNELLGLSLGTLIDVPLFDAALITLTTDFLEAAPEIKKRYAAGIHLGSRVPSEPFTNFKNISPALATSYLRNVDALYRLAMFDELIANVDRAGNQGNLVAVERYPSPPKYDFVAIDHGFAFTGPDWTVDALEKHLPDPVYPVLDVLRDLLVSRVALVADATHVAGLASRYADAVNTARTNLDDRTLKAILHVLEERCPHLVDWASGAGYSAHLPGLR